MLWCKSKDLWYLYSQEFKEELSGFLGKTTIGHEVQNSEDKEWCGSWEKLGF